MARSSYLKRVAKLADAGFIKEKDFRNYTKAKADKLRRIEPHYEKLRSYFKKGEYQIYQTKSASRRKSLDLLQPSEVRRWKLPYLIVHAGKRQLADKRVVQNQIKRISVTKKGDITIKTDGPTIRLPKINAKMMARDPEGTIAKIVASMGTRSRVKLRLGLGTSHGAFSPSTFPEFMLNYLNVYTDEDGNGGEFEGVEIYDL